MQQMLRIQMIGLALVAALFMSAVAAGSASAAHEWLINGAPLTSTLKVHSVGLVLLEDTKAPGGAVQVHCKGFDAGTVSPGGLDLVESVTAELLKGSDKIPCTFDKVGACKSNVTPTALALNLPWRTELVLNGTSVRDLILADGHGEPGWSVTCTNIFGGTTEDHCLAEAGKPGSVSLTNVAGGVLGTFDKLTPNAKCSLGGAESGHVEGTVLTENPSGTEKLTFD
jgi:hypothetical protein